MLYRETGNGVAAENAYRNAERLALALYGNSHPTTIDAERGLAAIYVDQGKLDQAEALFKQAQVQLTGLLGSDHPDLGSIDNSLGVIAAERGDVAAAEARLRRAIELWKDSPRLQGGVFNGENIRVEGVTGASDGPVTLGFRAEDAAIVPSGGQITAPIYSLELLGEASMVSMRVAGELVSIKTSKDFTAEIGSPISASVPARACHFFDRQSGKRIGTLAA